MLKADYYNFLCGCLTPEVYILILVVSFKDVKLILSVACQNSSSECWFSGAGLWEYAQQQLLLYRCCHFPKCSSHCPLEQSAFSIIPHASCFYALSLPAAFFLRSLPIELSFILKYWLVTFLVFSRSFLIKIIDPVEC